MLTPISQKRFNPRARGGRDPWTFGDCVTMMFQSTRPRGARQHLLNRLNLGLKSPLLCESINTIATGIVVYNHENKNFLKNNNMMKLRTMAENHVR